MPESFPTTTLHQNPELLAQSQPAEQVSDPRLERFIATLQVLQARRRRTLEP